MKFLPILLCAAGNLLAAAAPTSLTSIQRLEPEHLKATQAERRRLAEIRQSLPNHGVYEDFRAVMHIHAEDSDHTKGTRTEVLAAAKKTGVKVVMFTDHSGPKPETWSGLREGVLFFPGEENGGAGLIRFPALGAGATYGAGAT